MGSDKLEYTRPTIMGLPIVFFDNIREQKINDTSDDRKDDLRNWKQYMLPGMEEKESDSDLIMKKLEEIAQEVKNLKGHFENIFGNHYLINGIWRPLNLEKEKS